MNSLLYTLKVILLILLITQAQAEDKNDETLSSLVAKLIEVAESGAGAGKSYQEISNQLVKFDHSEVVEAVLPLLTHKKEGVPDLASYVISECEKGLHPEHLDQLQKGFNNGGSRLPSAIGSLGTDDALEFLVKEFRANPQIHCQVDRTIIRMGSQAIPFLMKEFDDANPETEKEFFRGLKHLIQGNGIYEGMKGEAKGAIPHLIKVAESDKFGLLHRQEAIKIMGCVGEDFIPYLPRLKALSDQFPEKFKQSVENAKFNSNTSYTAEIMANIFDDTSDRDIISYIGRLGIKAKKIGPRVLGWTKSSNWYTRVKSASLLGAIGYKEAVKPLEEFLLSESDWRLAYVSIQSLVELESTESISALEKASQDHWFQVVRDAAKEGIEILKTEKTIDDSAKNEHLRHDLFYSDDPIEIDKVSPTQNNVKDIKTRKKSMTKTHSFMDLAKEQPELVKKYIKANNLPVKVFDSIIELPIDNGVLLGGDAGEWIGGLHYAPNDGDYQFLNTYNVSGISKWKSSIFVATGRRLAGFNHGTIHKVIIKDGLATLEPWFVTPGSPTDLYVTEDDKMVVHCSGHTIAFSSKGDFEYFYTKDKEPTTEEIILDSPHK